MKHRGLSKSFLAVLFVVGILVGAEGYYFASIDPVSTSNGAVAQSEASVSSTNTPYLNLSVILANRLHDFMLNSTSNAYYYELSANWQEVVTSTYSTLGNAFITLGMIQLYQATANQTYLRWASSNAESFWRNGWDTVHGGFYDTYSTNWKNSTCQQTTQPNALFELDFLRLASANGSAVWLQRADAVENLLNSRFWSTSFDVVEQSYDVCTGTQSGDVQIEVSIGSYLWATAEWTRDTSNSTFTRRMGDAASFAEKYLWDGSSNSLPGGTGSTDCGTTSGYLGFMRSVYANLSGLEDCRKGANENIWGAMGLAELYSVNASSTLLQFTNRDLGWINTTFWDPTNGGYHEDAFRNDTLRSACSSTDDPRDYPGWTEGEQPMFWWEIGHLTGNATESSWAGIAEKWTAEHQWNYTDGNGGEMTCLNSNTLPDPNQNTLLDWVQGSALYAYSTISTGVTTITTETQTETSSTTTISSTTVTPTSVSPTTVTSTTAFQTTTTTTATTTTPTPTTTTETQKETSLTTSTTPTPITTTSLTSTTSTTSATPTTITTTMTKESATPTAYTKTPTTAATPTASESTTAPTTTIIPTTTSTAPTSSVTTSSAISSSTTSSGAIPEFPAQLGFALLITVAIVAS